VNCHGKYNYRPKLCIKIYITGLSSIFAKHAFSAAAAAIFASRCTASAALSVGAVRDAKGEKMAAGVVNNVMLYVETM